MNSLNQSPSLSVTVLKIMILGDVNVGKTSLLRRFHEGRFDDSACPTPAAGVDFFVHNIDVDGKSLKLHLWDTAGEEKHRSLTQIYFRGAHGVLLVFDITQRQSLENIRVHWLSELASRTENVIALLVGNKCDLEAEVSYKEAQDLANSQNISYIETSAKDGCNVHETFTTLTQMIIQHHQQHKSSTPSMPVDSIYLHKQSTGSQGSWSCCSYNN